MRIDHDPVMSALGVNLVFLLLACGETGDAKLTASKTDSAQVTDDATATATTDVQASADAGHAADIATAQQDAHITSACHFPLVKLQTGKDPNCGGGNTHMWPVGMAETACHGWQAVAPNGKQHSNSAAAIKCLPDGSFTFTQYAGNLTCQGSGVVKTYKAGVCQQDIPPALHTVAVDLSCCSDPSAAGCVKGTPSVTVPGATIFLNGVPCP